MVKFIELDQYKVKILEWEKSAKIFGGNPYILLSFTERSGKLDLSK